MTRSPADSADGDKAVAGDVPADAEVSADGQVIGVPARMTMLGRRPPLASRDSSPRMTMLRRPGKERA